MTQALASERLHKHLANLGLGSRRTIERWIEQEKICIDGKVARPGELVNSNHRITIHGQVVNAKLSRQPTRVLLYHKPEGEISARTDLNNRRTVFARLPKLKHARWVAVGRLDINTCGLLLFTNDGGVAHRLMHPSFNLEREYLCRVYGTVDADSIKRLTQGIFLGRELIRFQSVCRQSQQSAVDEAKRNHQYAQHSHHHSTRKNTWYSVVVNEGKYREVRRMWEAVGCRLSRLIRVRYGDVVLPKNLKPGQWQELKPAMIARLVQSGKCAAHQKSQTSSLRAKTFHEKAVRTKTPNGVSWRAQKSTKFHHRPTGKNEP